MKKLKSPQSLHEKIEGVRIARDDIDFIVELFSRDLTPPKISDDHFEFESLEEFIQHRGTKPVKLEIESVSTDTTYRSISAKFEGHSVWLYGSRNTPFHEAKEFLISKRPWSFKALTPWPWFYAALIAIGVMRSVAEAAKIKQEPYPEWPMYVLLISLGLITLGFLYRKFNFGLRLRRSYEGGFWTRNAEKIALTLVGTVVGAAVTWLTKAFGA
jgi:hypothetical protein